MKKHIDLKEKQIATDDTGLMPYEKCMRYGVSVLTDTELLAILLRTGTKGRSVLSVCNEILNLKQPLDGLVGLMHFRTEDYLEIEGIGAVKAMQLTVVGEIARRIWHRRRFSEDLFFTSPRQVSDHYQEKLRYLDHEEIHALFLDNQNRLLREEMMSRGSVNSAALTPREIFLSALRHHAVGIILVHNHPSGDPGPSEEDIFFTKRTEEAGRLLGITLMDHVIIGDHAYYSFKEQESFGEQNE